MDRDGFSKYLAERGFEPDRLADLVAITERFERHVGEGAPSGGIASFSRMLIDEGSNTAETFWALAVYGRFVGDEALTRAILAFADGGEALDNLFARLGEALGAEERDRVFVGIDLPPLGTPATELPAYTRRVMERIGTEVDPGTADTILSACLRDLEDEWFADARAHFQEHGDIDALIEWRRAALMETLEACHREGRPWFAQQIDEAVLSFVRDHPEISTGRREGDVVIEVKIPHMTKEWLAATDDQERRYHYCHCPWVKESFRQDGVDVPAGFCSCSAGFHKRFWEVVLGQPLQAEIRESVLAGDDRCTIAIHLPPGVAPAD